MSPGPDRSDGELERQIARLEAELAEERRRSRQDARQRVSTERSLERARTRAEQLERMLYQQRAEFASEARRVADSRAWRWGHALTRLLRTISFRRAAGRRGAADALAERAQLQLEAATPEQSRQGRTAALEPAGALQLSDARIAELLGRRAVSIVIPIHNAPDDLERCLDSVFRNTGSAHELILVDDASTDPRIAAILDRCEPIENVRAIRRPHNQGFAASANAGFEAADGDVVLLNSDTEVTPRWLENLICAAHSSDRVATATPLSNNAGAFSAPDRGAGNPLPVNMSRDEVGRIVSRGSRRAYPRAPTGNGFCMYVKRDALEELGGFDAEAFPRGYGEENDFCMRAAAAGWEHVIDDATIVFHRRQASFGAEKERLTRESRKVMDSRHPAYRGLVREFLDSPGLAQAQADVLRSYLAPGTSGARTRVLFVLHAGRGGTPQAALDLVRPLAEYFECFVLTSNTRELELSLYEDGRLVPLETHPLDPPWKVTDLSRPDYRAAVASILATWSIELVHVRHVIKHTFDMPEVARALGVPVVVSFHDHYLCCPTVHLLDQDNRHCEAICTPGDGDCALPTGAGFEDGTPPLKHRWVHEWRAAANRMLESADVCVTTSEHARKVHQRTLEGARRLPVEVIEHGRDLEQQQDLFSVPDPEGPVRILVAGNLTVSKGGELIREILSHDEAGRLEFHFIGSMWPEYADLGVNHGPYAREEYVELVRSIRPSFAGALSICGETYSHVLTEAWAAGLPVLANDIGTFGERVRRHGGGWLLDPEDARGSYERILEICSQPGEYRRVAAEARADDVPTTREVAARYELLYRGLAADRLSFGGRVATGGARAVGPAAGAGPPRRPAGARVMRVALALEGEPGMHPPSAHVRCLRPLNHPSVRPRLLATDGALEREWSHGSPDAVLVQRSALSAGQAERALAESRASGTPLLLELDDDLLSPDADGEDDEEPANGALRALAAGAARVIVSTEALREAASEIAGDVVVVPSMLDERLWLPSYGRPGANGDGVAAEGPLRVLYAGGLSHGPDLELVRPAVEELRARGLEFELEVVGGAPPEAGEGWYRRIQVPNGRHPYPLFAAWLREQAPRWALAIAPLRDTPFNRCKSDLKLLEYGALALPAVYSDVGVFASCADGETGLLAANETQAWTEALGRLLEDAGLRERLGAAAREYVIGERCLASRPSAYPEALEAA